MIILIRTNFEIRVEVTHYLQKMNDGSIVFIRKDIQDYFDFRGKYSVALKPHSELKFSVVFEADFQENTKSEDTLLPDKSVDLT